MTPPLKATRLVLLALAVLASSTTLLASGHTSANVAGGTGGVALLEGADPEHGLQPPSGRPRLAADSAPLGSPALSANLAAQGIEVRDVVVSNTDRALAATDRVCDGEPVIAVDPTNPMRIVLQTGCDGYESWQPGGCKPDPQYCPAGTGNARGSIFLSIDGGRTWTKAYAIPLPNGVNAGACVCDRVMDWGSDGRLRSVFLVFDHRIYMATTTDPASPADPAAWHYAVDGGGRAIPIASHSSLPVVIGPVGIEGYIDQPWTIVNPDPVDHNRQKVYVTYADDGSRGDDPRYSVWVTASSGEDPLNFDPPHELWGSPTCCAGDAVQTAQVSTQAQSVPTVKLAGDRRRGWVYALWGIPKAVAFFGPNRDGQQFDVVMKTSALVEQRLVRSIDGGRTWQLNGNPMGIVVDTAFSAEMSDKFATFNGLYGGTHSAGVDPATGDVYFAYGDLDPVTKVNRLAVRRVTTDSAGTAHIGVATFLSSDRDAGLPAVAVADNGTVGMLYDAYDGLGAGGFPTVSLHLAQSIDQGQTFSDSVLLRFLSVEKEDPNNTRQRPLGDYQQLKVVGDTFFGVATGNGAAFGRAVADWDPVFIRAEASGPRAASGPAPRPPEPVNTATTAVASLPDTAVSVAPDFAVIALTVAAGLGARSARGRRRRRFALQRRLNSSRAPRLTPTTALPSRTNPPSTRFG